MFNSFEQWNAILPLSMTAGGQYRSTGKQPKSVGLESDKQASDSSSMFLGCMTYTETVPLLTTLLISRVWVFHTKHFSSFP